ncbi:MAG: hydroxylamine reductase [Desulfobacteraceae bacterium]|nr:MAG: hydroxylamine reductase [Desulfobacteraceae bacterium]
MFCYQCEQTAKGIGCTKIGVCGKQPEVAALQDLLIYALKGLSQVAVEGRKVGVNDRETNAFTTEAAFSTLTNVDFDKDRFPPMINRSVELRERLKEKIRAAGGKADFPDGPANFKPEAGLDAMVKQGEAVGLRSDETIDADILGLQHTLLFGIKGVSAYADHARILGQEDDKVYEFVQEGLAATLNKSLGVDDYVGLLLKCGEINLRTMELLDAANTGTYGHPEPTQVPLGAKKGKAILVSGHDLKDMEEVLKQSEGKGIYVYTHGEMLPTHAYPGLKKKYPHFYGHYGTAWQNQAKEFANFPGAILMTTNCIQRPQESYKDNIFTTGLVGWPGVPHIADKNFAPVVKKALELPGFTQDVNGRSVMCGFGRNAVMGVAGQVIDAVKSGAIKHFFLVAGCDGAKPGRDYYTRFTELVPKDCVILTLACGKFRFFDKDFGNIGGIPRLLDVGQCNDAYSAIQIAVALSKAFNVGVNDLPLSMVLSWYEQKAVAILLTLFHLGIKNIRLGPSLPAFVTPNVLNVLVKNFNIMPITTPEEDLKAILG